MSLSEYKDIFVSEAKEYLKTLNNCVLDLEKDPEINSEEIDILTHGEGLKNIVDILGLELKK